MNKLPNTVHAVIQKYEELEGVFTELDLAVNATYEIKEITFNPSLAL